jgi:demethylmenaquinone methyltransferase/2-methoxy-6-polyprenyl-1,4-benzoquinol methylase
MDASWKRRLVDGLPDLKTPFCVDMACGTGDVTFLLADRYPDGEILGIDLTTEMIELSKRRNAKPNVTFEQRDMSDLDLEDNSVDIITGSYAIRNAPDLRVVLAEFQRVLKPGGSAFFLDFSKPVSKPGQMCQYGLMKFWGSLWGLVLHGNPEVHGYISESLNLFPDHKSLDNLFKKHGFEIEQSNSFLFGMTMLYHLKTVPFT